MDTISQQNFAFKAPPFVILNLVYLYDASTPMPYTTRVCWRPIARTFTDMEDTMLKFMRFLDGVNEPAPPPKQGHKRCSECHNECPLSDFVRRATLSQSKAWTKNPHAKKRLSYEGKTCNACHNAHRLNSMDMSPEAYRKRLINEGLNPLKVEARVEARRIRGIVNRKNKSAKTRLNNLMPELQPMFDEIDALENKLANKMVHLKRTNEGESEIGRAHV